MVGSTPRISASGPGSATVRLCWSQTYLIVGNLMSRLKLTISLPSADPEGGDRGSGPPPPGKSQVIWVSIGNKQSDPPPPPWKKLNPLWNLKK